MIRQDEQSTSLNGGIIFKIGERIFIDTLIIYITKLDIIFIFFTNIKRR
jgi:hypothetical protein